MKIFDGKFHAEILENRIAEHLSGNPCVKTLLIVQIGENLSSDKYIGLKTRFCEKHGIPCEVMRLSGALSDAEIRARVGEAFAREDVGGGIIQLPLPRPSLAGVLSLIPSQKDVDCISGRPPADTLSPVVRAFDYFTSVSKTHLSRNRVYIIGRGAVVGTPIQKFAEKSGAIVITTEDYKAGQKVSADFVVLSAGVPRLVKGEDISVGAHVADFGSTVVDGKITGDLDLGSELNHLGLISPSPGGAGPLVVRFLIMNFLGM